MHHWVLKQKDQPHCKDRQNQTFNRSHQLALTVIDSALTVYQCSSQPRRQLDQVSMPILATCTKTSHTSALSKEV